MRTTTLDNLSLEDFPMDEEITSSNPNSRNTFEYVSKVAYLIGVERKFFKSVGEDYKFLRMDIYKKLDRDKNAQIIRALCMARTAIERNFKNINDAYYQSNGFHYSVSKYVTREVMAVLEENNINIITKSQWLTDVIIEINKEINNRINNCKIHFPSWLKWEYVKDLFIMPNGLTAEGTKEAAELYYSHKELYPYTVYINWEPQEEGNILYNDKKFVELLYQWNNDVFTDTSKVSDVGDVAKDKIFKFIQDSNKTCMIVDCENSDPLQLISVYQNMDQEIMGRINSLVLISDERASSIWKVFHKYVSVPVEYICPQRLLKEKSLCDPMLVATCCTKCYKENVDSIMLVSSDSDFSPLIDVIMKSSPKTHFLVMLEHDFSSYVYREFLKENNIPYYYLNSFYSGNIEHIKEDIMLNQLKEEICKKLEGINLSDCLDTALRSTRMDFSSEEKKQFVNKYVKNMKLAIRSDGTVEPEFNR